jgi:AbrB family looped-hinge helix DNA binding protein
MVKGVVRGVDDLGRIVIPMEYRKTANIEEGMKLAIRLDGNIIRAKIVQADFVGMNRPIDRLGRFTIPKSYRRQLNYTENELLDIYVEGDEICLKKEALQCVFCGSSKEDRLIIKDDVYVCEDCIRELRDQIGA